MGVCLACSALVGVCFVCSVLVDVCLVGPALVGVCLVGPALVGVCLVCSALVGAWPARVTSRLRWPARVTSRLRWPARVTSRLRWPARVTSRLRWPARVTSRLRWPARVTSPLTCQSHLTSPLTCQSHLTSPLTCQSHLTSPLTCQSHLTSPLTCQSHLTARVTSRLRWPARVTSRLCWSARVTSRRSGLPSVPSRPCCLVRPALVGSCLIGPTWTWPSVPSPGSTSAPPPSWSMLCVKRLEAALRGGGSVMNLVATHYNCTSPMDYISHHALHSHIPIHHYTNHTAVTIHSSTLIVSPHLHLIHTHIFTLTVCCLPFWPCLPVDIFSVCCLPRPLHCPCCWFCLAFIIPVTAFDPCLFDLLSEIKLLLDLTSLPHHYTRALRPTVEIHIWDPNGLYIWNPALYRFSRIHRVRAWRRTLRHVQLPRGWRSLTGSTVDSLEQFLASRPETGAPQCFYPFEVRTQEETGSTRRL